MGDKITLIFNQKPSDVLTLWKAWRSRKSQYVAEEIIPEIHVKRPNFHVDPAHLESFNNICAIEPTHNLHILYPFTLIYSYLMRILCRTEMPFSQFKILNSRNQIIMFRAIKLDEQLEIDCYNSSVKIIPKGLECHFKAEVFAENEKVWEITSTYFNRGKFGEADPQYMQPRLESLENPSMYKEWFLAANDRFKFAKVSGDTNGIHYWSPYARLLGFKRDFAQPIRVTAQCISNLPNQVADKPGKLDFFLKGQVYYESMLTLKNQHTDRIDRFDLYCSGNEKPCISGRLEGL